MSDWDSESRGEAYLNCIESVLANITYSLNKTSSRDFGTDRDSVIKQ